MKKLIALAFATLAFAGSASAFDGEPEEGFSYQIFAGMNTSSISTNDLGAFVGATAGARAQYFLPKAHGTYVAASLDWSWKGGQNSAKYDWANGTQTDVSSTYKSQLHYIEVPIHIGYHYNLNDKLGFYADFGPYFAFGVAGKSGIYYSQDGEPYRSIENHWNWNSFRSSPSAITTPEEEHQQSFQNWDSGFGFLVGAEYNKHYSLNLGFNWGIADIYRKNFRDAWANKYPGTALPKAHNFTFSLTFAYRI